MPVMRLRIGALALDALARLLAAEFQMSSHGYLPAVLPALRRIVSSMYLMPLPLYGSGGRKLRIFAAAPPSSCLSMPREDQHVLVRLGRDALGQLVLDRVREPERERDARALDLGLVADAVDLELAGEARRSRP